MKKFLTVALTAAAVALCSSAFAGQIWTDGNGDGLPDGGPPISAPPSSNVTVGVWFDAQAFTFTNFLAYIEWQGQCVSYVSATYVISGGSNFPIDNFSHPSAIGFGGSGFNRGGVVQVGNATFHVNVPTACCITPIIDQYNPYYVFSQLGAGSAYMLFTTNPGTCYGEAPPLTGACCFTDGSCQILTGPECAAQGGIYRGDGVSCADANCEPPATEACCFPDGSCVDANVGQCPAGSQPQGAGTTCAGVNCPDIRPRGACCFPDFTCQPDQLQGDCEAAGGTWLFGEPCTSCPQPPELGACCLEDGTCIDALTRSQCDANGGLFFPNALCQDVTCPGNAVEPKSWGNIKGLYR
jgi:hypothetical protein